ncbi:PREDICTED: uncharacterized protein LOC105457327 [Wasmannia auropunctata]|uniref:uncharacterized protein LOC105457327 n=1 Tax=Wasmannia auropunctata TaxID=64793 RepID=UPI0005F01DD9|nr:PREDICTED: uncharacterized protein LOC105457327 [Wasmannia auropunctata]
MDKMQCFRPSGEPPKVWKHIEKTDKDGKLLKFTIQEIPEDRYEDAIEHMCTYYIVDEPVCNYFNAKNDPLFVQDISMLWRLVLMQGISIAAFVDNPNGGKPIIAGMNALGIAAKNEKDFSADFQHKSKNAKSFMEICIPTKMVYECYGIDKYLFSFGLSVDPVYRGYGLGKDFLKMRDHIGPKYGVSATSTVFSSIFSQKSAADAGFEEFLTKKIADWVDENGKEKFPGIKSKEFKFMGKRFF